MRSREAAQYREQGALLFRGFTVDDIMNQCFGTYLDSSGMGKQMPAVSIPPRPAPWTRRLFLILELSLL